MILVYINIHEPSMFFDKNIDAYVYCMHQQCCNHEKSIFIDL